MFTDAQYQPHSSSVRVTALAAMSPGTPTHLALPPWRRRRRRRLPLLAARGEEHFLSGALMEDVERSPCALTHAIKAEGSRAFIYLSDCFFFLSSSLPLSLLPLPPCDSGHGATPPPPPFPEPLPLPLLPFAVWKQPFSRGD